jgi:hypothetical protein
MAKQLESEKNQIVKDNGIEVWRGINIPENMIKDAFPALALAILQEWMMSGITKQLIFESMMGNLKKMNYQEEEIDEFKKAVNECFAKFHKPNGFMG